VARKRTTDRTVSHARYSLEQLLETHSVGRVLNTLANVCESRAAALVPDDVELDQAAEFAEYIAAAIRRVARGIEAAEERRTVA
jgi:hypothetical protein